MIAPANYILLHIKSISYPNKNKKTFYKRATQFLGEYRTYNGVFLDLGTPRIPKNSQCRKTLWKRLKLIRANYKFWKNNFINIYRKPHDKYTTFVSLSNNNE